MFLTEEQVESTARKMFEDREMRWALDNQDNSQAINWHAIEESHRQAWRDTVRDSVKFAAPILEAQFTAELEEIFSGFFKGFLEARVLRNEVKVDVSA